MDNKIEDLTGSSFPVPIIVKLRKGLSLPGDGQNEDLFFQTNIIDKFQDAISRIKIRRLFTSLTSSEIDNLVNKAKALDKGYQPANFAGYYVIGCPTEISAETLLQNLLANKNIELAYIINDAIPPHVGGEDHKVLDALQGYLGPAPDGVNAEYAWSIRGGNGEGKVKFIDIEQGWLLGHEDIKVNTLTVTGLNYAFHDHGAAVLGIITMKKNGSGGRGIATEANGYVVSQWRPDGNLNNADAIMAALAHANYGDIILIQAQVRGKSTGKRLWPVEVHAANFDAIRLGTALGIIIIEPAANGSSYFNLSGNLDQFVLNGKKILDRSEPDFKDSGAIMVAGASASVPHKGIYNSNFGSRIDCYAWGESVYTAGNFPNSSNGAVNLYTKQFCGTSSAAAIIAGVAISIQSIVEANYNSRLGPAEMREILSNESFGTASKNGHLIDRIGVMPDLKKIIDKALVDIFRSS